MCLSKYFLPVSGLSSLSLDIVYNRAKFFHSNEVHLIHYFFHGILPLMCLQKGITILQVIIFSLMLSSRSVIILHSSFRLMIHFELVFVKDVKTVSRSFLCIWKYSCPNTTCKDTLWSILWSLLPCQWSLDYIYMGLFLCCLLYSIDLVVYSFTNSTLSWFL